MFDKLLEAAHTESEKPSRLPALEPQGALIPWKFQPSPIHDVVKATMPWLDVENGPWLAGGAGRLMANGEDIGTSDIDVFFPNEQIFRWACSYMEKVKATATSATHGFLVTMQDQTPNSECFFIQKGEHSYRLQFLKKRWFSSLAELLDDFDFTVCMFAADCDTLICDERAPRDVAVRQLVLHRPPEKPKAARLAKYCAHGFMPAPGVASQMFGVYSPKYNFVTDDLCCDEY